MENFGGKLGFLWSIAELLRDAFKRSKYQDVILPFTVLRRIDCVLAPTKEAVVRRHHGLKGKLDNPWPQCSRVGNFAFCNVSPYGFPRLLAEPASLAANLRAYTNGFSPNMRAILGKLGLHDAIAKLQEAGLLSLVVQRFSEIDLRPDVVSNHKIRTIFDPATRVVRTPFVTIWVLEALVSPRP